MSDENKFEESAFITGLIKKMDKEIASSFTKQQLSALEEVLCCKSTRLHSLDFRNTIRIWNRSYYYVLLAGVDHRSLTRNQKHALRRAELAFLMTLASGVTLIGLFFAYLLKSFLGIDISPNQSVGLWDWIKETFN